jgi:segregation and condensation protein B
MARAKRKIKQDEQIEQEIPAAEETAEVSGEAPAAAEEAPVVAEAAESEDPALEVTQADIRLVEAILFATSSALTVGMIAERFPADRAKVIPDVLEHLRSQYEGRGVTLVQRDSRWAFRTSSDLADQLRLEKEQPKKFTRSAMETMAVIAYHQPVTRAEIENIRGVQTSPGALDALMEAGWIKPGKRREVPGRPVTWLSTQGFLDHFGLEKLEDLPGMDELKAAGLLDKRPAIEAMPTADLFGENENVREEDPAEVTDEDLIGKTGEEETGEAEGHEEAHEEEDHLDEEDSDEEDFEDEDDEEDDDDDGDEEDME